MKVKNTIELEIANTIKRQIMVQSPHALMSYGAKNFVALGETDKRHAGLQFQTLLRQLKYGQVRLRYVIHMMMFTLTRWLKFLTT